MPARKPFLVLPLFALASCGSGVVAGILAGGSSGGSRSGEARVPAVELPAGGDSAPLRFLDLSFLNLPPGSEESRFRTVTIRNIDRAPGGGAGRLVVVLEDRGLGVRAPQLTFLPSPFKPGGRNLALFFQVDPKPFYDRIKDAPRDLDVELTVELDGRRLAPPVTFHFYRNPEFDEGVLKGRLKNGVLRASVDGSTMLSLPVRHLRAQNAAKVAVEVYQLDFRTPSKSGRLPFRRLEATGVSLEPASGTPGVTEVKARIPAARFAGTAFVVVKDAEAGRSDPQPLLYMPELFGLGPASSPLEGGALSVLIGSGLVPVENRNGRLTFLFDRIELRIRKGGRTITVPSQSILEELSNDRQLVFYMPPSPDGRPGAAALDLAFPGVQGRRIVRSLEPGKAAQVPRYAVGNPRLWPLVNPLLQGGIDLAKGFFFSPASSRVHDLAILDRVEEFAQAMLLVSGGFGLYRPAGRPIATFGPGYQAARFPLGVLAGDFDTKEGQDLFAVGGAPNSSIQGGEHALLSANLALPVPFSVVLPVHSTPTVVFDRATGDFDGDGWDDVLLLRGTGPAAPGIEVRFGPFERLRKTVLSFPRGFVGRHLEVADLNGDGYLDAAVATETAPWRVLVMFGDGRGGVLRSEVRSYDPDGKTLGTGQRAIDLLSFSPTEGSGGVRHLLVPVRNEFAPFGGKQWLVPLHFDRTKRTFKSATLTSSAEIPGKDLLVLAFTADMVQGSAGDEVLLAQTGTAAGPLQLWTLGEGRPKRAAAAVDPSAGILVPEAAAEVTIPGAAGRLHKAVLLLHSEAFDQEVTPTISVFVEGDTGLLPRVPVLPLQVEPDRLLFGDFDGDGRGGDLAAVTTNEVTILPRSFEVFYPKKLSIGIPAAGVFPGTLAAVERSGTHLFWLSNTGLLSWLPPKATIPNSLGDLRTFLPQNRRNLLLSPSSRLLPCDFDGDGARDLLAVLVPDPGGGRTPTEGFLLPLSGDPNSSAGKPPILLPAAGTVPGRILLRGTRFVFAAADLLGHRARREAGVELAYAYDKNLRFATLRKDAAGRWVWGTEAVLRETQVGLYPSELLATDLDEDGRTDLAVVLDQERRVRIFLNRITADAGRGYAGGLTTFPGPNLNFPGTPVGAVYGDFDGDGLEDIFVLSLVQRGVSLEGGGTLFRSQGRGSFVSAYVYPRVPFMVGVPKAFAAADLDGNGLTDVVAGRYPLLSR